MAAVGQRQAWNGRRAVAEKEKEKDVWKIVLWGQQSAGKTSFAVRVRMFRRSGVGAFVDVGAFLLLLFGCWFSSAKEFLSRA